MKSLSPHSWLPAVAFAAFSAFATAALAAPEAGAAAFTTEGRTYLGRYTAADQALSVEIDGSLYRGHYATHAEDGGTSAQSALAAGQGGRAFLFASSAKVLQCQLDTGFPQVSGLCEGADGRKFELEMPARP